jgi:hypothetical protein
LPRGLDQRVWSVMERSLWEFDHSPGPRPELWPLIHECLVFIIEQTPEEIIRGIKQCRLNTNYLLAWIILECRQHGLADEKNCKHWKDFLPSAQPWTEKSMAQLAGP